MKPIVFCLALAATTAGAQTLNAPEARLTDPAIHADHASYQRQQAAIKAANDGGQRVASYALAKAQCWLDVSVHEYSRNDRTAFPAEALAQSVGITRYLAQPVGENPALRTPLVAGAERLRDDLWAAAAVLAQVPGAVCAERHRACAEVELVHAGHEYAQVGWRHAKPYIQLAEDWLDEGRAAAAACLPAPVAAPAPAPAPLPQPVLRSTEVLFAFDGRDWPAVRPYTAERLDALLREFSPAQITRVTLTGHADVSNHTGQRDYNLRLAQDRAETVRAHLVAAGVPPERITAQARSDQQPVVSCEKERAHKAAYEACLLPNRRVEVVIEGGR